MGRTLDCVVSDSGDATKLRTLQLDASTLALMLIDYDHHEAHGGSAFKIALRSLNLSTTPLHVHFTTPPATETKRLHMICRAWAGGEAEFIWTEDATGITGGTPISPHNQRRESNKTSIIQGACFSGGTVPTGGVELDGEYLGQSGAGSSSTSASGSRGENEEILKPNTVYSIRLSGGAVRGNLHLGWYEHSDKEVINLIV